MSQGSAADVREAREAIVALLRSEGRRMPTREIAKANAEKGVRCPDSSVRFLTALRAKGVIKGEVSMEMGGWVWWVEDECEGDGGE